MKKINLEQYTKDIYNSGYYVGLMTVAYPIKELLVKFLEEKNDPIGVLNSIATVVQMSVEGQAELNKTTLDNLKEYNFNVEGLEIEVEEVNI